MNKITQSFKVLMVLCGILLLPLSKVVAQSVTFDNTAIFTSNGSTLGGVCFNFTTSQSILLEHVRCNLSTTNGTATIWYNPNKISGQPNINAANGWINLGTTPVSGTASASNRNALTTIPVLMNLDVNAGDTIGIAIQWTGSNYPATTIVTPTASNGVVTMIADANSAYAFNPSMGTFYSPRQIIGGVTYRLKAISANDLGIANLVAPIDFCTGIQNIQVKLKNYANARATSGIVNWSIDGVSQTPINLALALDSVNGAGITDTTITLGSYNFTGNAVTLKAWSSLPNGVADTVNVNDTLTVLLRPSLSGTYTLNAANPTAGTNFQTIADLNNALNTYGVCGPVVVNVVANSGPYTGKLALVNVPGTSAVNTVTINGNDNVFNVATAASNGNREMLLLDNVRYITIKDIEFKTTGIAAWGALITGGSSLDSIIDCKFDLSNITSTASTSNAGIIFSGNNSSATAAGSSGTNIVLKGNHILGSAAAGGVYYGVGLNADADSNLIINNIIENHYNSGVYIGVNTYNRILNNDIIRPNKTSGFTTSYGINGISGASTNHLIEGNRIINSGAANATNTSTYYGIYWLADGTAALPNIIANNVFSNNKGGTLYGVYLSTASQALVYHNTINLNENTGNASTNYGLYATGTNTGSEFKNNNVVITAGSTGTKYGFYYSSPSSINDVQKNNIYVNSANAGTQNYGYYTTAYATQALFQAARPTLEINSPSVNPQYLNVASGNYIPTNPALIAKGVNVLNSVPKDILGITRTIVPTIGAYEKDFSANNNLAILDIANPNAPYCIDSQTVRIVVGNFGANTINTYKITGTYNNQPLDTFNYAAPLTTVTANAVTAFDTIVVRNFLVDANVNNLKLWVVNVNDSLDADASDDSLSVDLQGVNFELGVSENTVCGTGKVRFSMTPALNIDNAVWQASLDGNTWTNIAGANGSIFDTTVLNQLYVRVNIPNGVNGCFTNVQQVQYLAPTLLATTEDSACVFQPLTLTAEGNNGSDIYWYTSPTSDTVFAVGDSLYLAGGLKVTDTFYVAAVNNKTNATVGPLNTFIGTSARVSNTYSTAFTVTKNLVLNSVDIYANAVNLTSAIVIRNEETNQIVGTFPFTTTNAGVAINSANVISLNVALAPGEYSMGLDNGISVYRNSTGANYPYVANGLTITGHSNNFATNDDDFYNFYNWKFETGCSSDRQAVIAKVLETPEVNLGADIDKCYPLGDYEFLNAQNPGSTYLWDDGSTSQVRVVGESGKYWVLASNANGCNYADTIHVNYKRSPISLLPEDTAVCIDATVTLDPGNSGIQYYWSNGANTQSTKVTRPGYYRVNITGSNGCITADSVNVIMQGEAPQYDNVQARSVNANSFKFRLINPTHITQMRWDFGDGNFSNDEEPTHSYASDGNYIVVVHMESSCGAATDTITVHIKGFTSIEDRNVSSEVKVYPNPAATVVNIESMVADSQIEMIQLFDITGKSVMTVDGNRQSKVQLDIANLAAGMYQVQIVTNKGVQNAKVEKLK